MLSLAKSGPMLVYMTHFLFLSHDVGKAFPEKIFRRPPEPSEFTTYNPGRPTKAILSPSGEKEG
jgi:hypothetical protein